MAKACVRLHGFRPNAGALSVNYTVAVDGGTVWSGGHELSFPLPATLRADILTKVISQAADRGVTILATDIVISGIPA